jgi:glycosyltransferase involved in cell wall biosynthesis
MIAPACESPLRIALVADHYAPHLGGIETHVQALAQQLSARGHDVHVITTYPGNDTDDGLRVHRVRVPLVPAWNIAYTPSGIRRLETLLRTEAPDIVHVHHSVFSPAAACAAFVAQRLGIRTVCTFHSVLRGYTAAFSMLDRCAGWSSWPVTYSAVSSAVASDVRRLMPHRQIPILANGVDAAYWRVPHVAAEPGVVRIISTMRLAPRKRPRALIEMTRALVDRLPAGLRLQVRIIGDGPERAATGRRIAALGLTETVELLGRRARGEVRDWYARSDLFVLPTIEESFGLSALEARSAGLPVVALRASGVSGFIGHGAEGMLADDDAGLVEAMAQLVTNDTLRHSIAAHNLGTTPPFTWADVLTSHERIYRMPQGAHA